MSARSDIRPTSVQKLYRSANRTCRSAYEGFKAKMCMKSPLVTLLVGFANLNVFVTFVASIRTSTRWVPPRGNERKTRHVEVPAAGAAELIQSRRPEPNAFRLRPRGGIVVRALRANLADLRHGAHEITGLGVSGRVQCRPVGGHRERRTAERREDAVDLPIVDQHSRDTVTAFTAPRQLVHGRHLEYVRAVAVGQRPVEFLNFGSGNLVVGSQRHRAAECVVSLQQQPLNERPRNAHLQRVIRRPAIRRVDLDVVDTSE